ncbi:hypothetical protein EV2_026029 [Malus domestica]
MVKISTTLSPPIRLVLISFLQENTEVFAWSYEDMPGISPDIIFHRLSIDPKTKPVRQKRRSYDAKRYKAMKVEVEKTQRHKLRPRSQLPNMGSKCGHC